MHEQWKELIKPEHKLLDIGCWDGKRILELKDRCDVYGLDIDKTKFLGADEAIKNRLHEGDILRPLPFNTKFDFILLRDVLEHLYGEELALENINKGMNVGGHIVISTPKHIPFFNWYDPAWIRWSFGGEPHRHFKKKELFSLLQSFGFEIEDYHLEGTIHWLFTRWVNGFFKYVLRSKKQIKSNWKPGYFNWVIVAKKEREI